MTRDEFMALPEWGRLHLLNVKAVGSLTGPTLFWDTSAALAGRPDDPDFPWAIHVAVESCRSLRQLALDTEAALFALAKASGVEVDNA